MSVVRLVMVVVGLASVGRAIAQAVVGTDRLIGPGEFEDFDIRGWRIPPGVVVLLLVTTQVAAGLFAIVVAVSLSG